MLKVIAEDFIHAESVEKPMPLYKELIAKTRTEKLCISYELFVDRHELGHFIFIEEWPDQAALDIHCQTEHFKRIVPLINQYQRKSGIFTLMGLRIDPD